MPIRVAVRALVQILPIAGDGRCLFRSGAKRFHAEHMSVLCLLLWGELLAYCFNTVGMNEGHLAVLFSEKHSQFF